MKKSILIRNVLLIFFAVTIFSPIAIAEQTKDTKQQVSNSTPPEKIDLSVLYNDGASEKALADTFEKLKKIDSIQCKIFLAYCYFNGVGTKIDKNECGKILDQIESPYTFSDYIICFLNNKKSSLEFAKLLASKAEKGIPNTSIIYRNFIPYYNKLSSKDKKLLDSKIEDYKKNPKENTHILLKYYLATNNFDAIETIKEFLPVTPFAEAEIRKFYIEAVNNNDSDKIVKIDPLLTQYTSENSFIEINKAYCLYIGLATKPDKKRAKQLVLKALKNDVSSGSSFIYMNNVFDDKKFSDDQKEFFILLAETMAENDSKLILAQFYIYGIFMGKDTEKGICLLAGSKDIDYNILIINELKRSGLVKKYKQQYFNSLKVLAQSKDIRDSCIYNIKLISCYKNGIGTKPDSDKTYKLIEETIESVKANTDIFSKICHVQLLEMQAYCCDNAIGTNKSAKRAEQLRSKIDDVAQDLLNVNIKSSNPNKINAYVYCMNLYGKEDEFADDEKMCRLYEEKMNILVEKIKFQEMSPEEKECIETFNKIADMFAGRNGVKKDEISAKALLEDFYKKVDKCSDGFVNDIFKKIMYSKQSSFPLRIASMEYLAEIARVNHKSLAEFVSECYYKGKGTSRKYDKAGDFALIAANYNIDTKRFGREDKFYYNSAFGKADGIYAQIDNFKKQNQVISNWRKVLPNSKKAMISEARFLSLEGNPYRDLKKSKEIFEEVLKNTSEMNELLDLARDIGGFYQGNYVSIYYNFKFLKKAESLYGNCVDDSKLAALYRCGIATPRDDKKAGEYYLKHVKSALNNKSKIDNRTFQEIACYFLYDTNGRDYETLKQVLDAALTQDIIDPDAFAVKGLTYLNGWGVEKDRQKAYNYFDMAVKSPSFAKYYTPNLGNVLSNSNQRYSCFQYSLPKEVVEYMLKKFEEEKKDEDMSQYALQLVHAYCDIGDFENAKKYAKICKSKSINRNLPIDLVVDIVAIGNGTDEKKIFERVTALHKKHPKSQYVMNLLASFYYNGIGVEVEKAKALEILKEADKQYWGDNRWGIDVLQTYIMMWKIYNESNQPQLADKIKKAIINKKRFTREYSPSQIAALAFTGKSIFFEQICHQSIDKQLSERWLEIAEQEEMQEPRHADSTPIRLIYLYRTNENFKNEDAALRIEKRMKEKLDSFLKL